VWLSQQYSNNNILGSGTITLTILKYIASLPLVFIQDILYANLKYAVIFDQQYSKQLVKVQAHKI